MSAVISLEQKRFAHEVAKKVVFSWVRTVPFLQKPCQGVLANLQHRVEMGLLQAIERYAEADEVSSS